MRNRSTRSGGRRLRTERRETASEDPRGRVAGVEATRNPGARGFPSVQPRPPVRIPGLTLFVGDDVQASRCPFVAAGRAVEADDRRRAGDFVAATIEQSVVEFHQPHRDAAALRAAAVLELELRPRTADCRGVTSNSKWYLVSRCATTGCCRMTGEWSCCRRGAAVSGLAHP